MKNALIVIVALLVLAGGGWFLYSSMQPKDALPPPPGAPAASIPAGAHVITLTKDGFSPSTLTIKKGETVAFVTNAGQMFWPASNLHPSHLLYPEFDPKAPIQADEEWSFTFDKVGDHPFHDHLAPYFTGVITVTE